MVQFDEYDLLYTDYINTITNDYNPDYIAIADLETVNLREKFEVIYFCDDFLKKYRMDKDVANFQMIERLARQCQLKQVIDRKSLIQSVEAGLVDELSSY